MALHPATMLTNFLNDHLLSHSISIVNCDIFRSFVIPSYEHLLHLQHLPKSLKIAAAHFWS
jgi:hypothetical protein